MLKKYKKIKKNPMNFSYNILLKWIYLHLGTCDDLKQCVHKCIRELRINELGVSVDAFDAIYIIIEYYWNVCEKIFKSNSSIIEKNIIWRNNLLDNSKDLTYILRKNRPNFSFHEIDLIVTWWAVYDGYSVDEFFNDLSSFPYKIEQKLHKIRRKNPLHVQQVKKRKNPLPFSLENFRRWMQIYLLRKPNVTQNQISNDTSLYFNVPLNKIILLPNLGNQFLPHNYITEILPLTTEYLDDTANNRMTLKKLIKYFLILHKAIFDSKLISKPKKILYWKTFTSSYANFSLSIKNILILYDYLRVAGTLSKNEEIFDTLNRIYKEIDEKT